MTSLGAIGILERPKLAFFCSGACPGSVIIQTQDLAQWLRRSALAVVSGFQSPVERECLTVLLRGPAPVIVCPARGIGWMRVKRKWRPPLEEGRLLVVSRFEDRARRVTAQLAVERNRFVVELADRVLVAHAAPGSKTLDLCREVAGGGKPLYTFADPANEGLRGLGAEALSLEGLRARLAGGW